MVTDGLVIVYDHCKNKVLLSEVGDGFLVNVTMPALPKCWGILQMVHLRSTRIDFLDPVRALAGRVYKMALLFSSLLAFLLFALNEYSLNKVAAQCVFLFIFFSSSFLVFSFLYCT